MLVPENNISGSMGYLRPASGQWKATIEVRRSRFLALAARVLTEADARSFVSQARADYPDARHHCSAFIINGEGTSDITRSSDDGEPSGTAGQPILEVLRGSELRDVVVVVVRWFGGVKLGTGGLVRAYQNATHAVVNTVKVVQHQPHVRWECVIPHAEAGRLEAELRHRGFAVTADYGPHVTLGLLLSPEVDPTGTIAALTGGAIDIRRVGVQWCEVQPDERGR